MLKYLFLLLLVTFEIKSQDVSVEPLKPDCGIKSNEEQNCETCISKGTDCFWCGGNEGKCLPYDWYFPQCPFDDVQYKHCWVSISAVVIVLCVLAGIVLVLLFFAFCYCCCRYRAYNRSQAKKKGEKWNMKQDAARLELQQRHSMRSEERNKQLDEYRQKYGIPSSNEKETKK